MLFTHTITLAAISLLTLCRCTLFPLEVHCKHTALPAIRYLTIRWPAPSTAATDYKRYEVRIAQPREDALRVVETEVHEVPREGEGRGGFEAVVPILREGPVEVSVWGELRGGWVLLSIVTAVNACRQYRL